MTQRAPKNRPRQPCGTRHMPGAVALLLACASAGAATPTMTIAEGKITVFSGGAAYLPKAGLQLRTCDVIRTGPKALVQIEYDDGGRIVLGPDSRLVVDLPLGGDPVVGPHYLLSGWVKLTVPKRDKAAAYRIDTPQFNLATDSGVAALRVGEHDAAFFVEQGTVTALVPSGRSLARVQVGNGRTFVRKGPADRGAVTQRADPAFVQAMPTAFRDTLPSLLAHVKGRDSSPRPSPDDNAAEVEGWFRAAPELGACIVDPTLRAAQRTLESAGFEVGPIDGILGPRTQAALRAFQEKQGLSRSGKLDAPTQKALEELQRR
ncbi:MAG: peptidoglycan-binding protein [Ideonella sp.]|nr:peptidoglycan-binding protein [Ideonella sp.]